MSFTKHVRLKILLFLFILNFITLLFYFSFHHDHHPTTRKDRQTLTENRLNSTRTTLPAIFHPKPWPILPSYLPWTLNPNVRTNSCEAYFGNGYTERIDVFQSPELRRRKTNPGRGGSGGGGGGGGGWFRCYYSETLRSSICEGGRVRMHPEKIVMSGGGERLETVMGRPELVEFPEFEFGAFDIEIERGQWGNKVVNVEVLDRIFPGDIERHTMRDLIDSMRVVGPEEFECSQWIEEPTLLVTRFEYANLFHTVTDWYGAYVASRVAALPNRPNVIFVDGHCETHLEETWEALFSSLRYAKNFSSSVCFRHVILSPIGYETVLFEGLDRPVECGGASAHDLWLNPDDRKTARLSEFGEMIRAAFGFPVDRNRLPKPVSGHNILFVRREDYLAHPRHRGKVQSRLINEEEVFQSLKSWVVNYSKCKLNLVNGLFAHMRMKEQVRAIQDASVIIGAHGAGLTHIVSATPNTVILEIVSREYRRPHFAYIAEWKGLEYHAIYLPQSYVEPDVVTKKLGSILSRLGC